MNGSIDAVIYMTAKTGAFTVYGLYDFSDIIKAGCKALGYTTLIDTRSEPIKVTEKVTIWKHEAYISITPKEKGV